MLYTNPNSEIWLDFYTIFVLYVQGSIGHSGEDTAIYTIFDDFFFTVFKHFHSISSRHVGKIPIFQEKD